MWFTVVFRSSSKVVTWVVKSNPHVSLADDNENDHLIRCKFHVAGSKRTDISGAMLDGGRSQWPRGLRCGSTAARLLGLWVWIQPGTWMSVCVKWCVLSGRGLCNGLIIHPEKSYRLWCIGMCDLETSRMRRPWPVLCHSFTGGMLDGGSTFPWNGSKCLPDGSTESHSMRRQ